MKTLATLKREAIESHRQGEPWQAYWQRHADDVRRLEPYAREKFRDLYLTLLHIHVTGEESGRLPPPAEMPWERDEVQTPDDTHTEARLQLTLWQ